MNEQLKPHVDKLKTIIKVLNDFDNLQEVIVVIKTDHDVHTMVAAGPDTGAVTAAKLIGMVSESF